MSHVRLPVYLFLNALFAAGSLHGQAVGSDGPTVPPWKTEPALREAARSATVSGPLDPRRPAGGGPDDRGFILSNPQIRAQIWGSANRITVSLLKTDVWDRRYASAQVVTLQQVTAGVESPANQGFDDMPAGQRRPVRGYLLPTGGRIDPYVGWNAYPFPCQKPVGQIIIGLDGLAAGGAVDAVQSCANGVVSADLPGATAKTHLELALSMTRNVFVIRGQVPAGVMPWIRLYRHVDQSYRRYMAADAKTYLTHIADAPASARASGADGFDYAKDASWNGPMRSPESGTDGRYFWIRQRLPAEKTFPNGFEYVLMGVTTAPGAKNSVATADGVGGLGTPAYGSGKLEESYRLIRAAPGSAATVALTPDSAGLVGAYVTVVTSNDSRDVMGEARKRLDLAASAGFAGIAAENERWYGGLYDRREDGRLFVGSAGATASEDIPEVFDSWACHHGGFTKPDMRRFEATAAYAEPEQDWQPWHSLPCYNEIFYTPTIVRNRADAIDLWWQLIAAWAPAARANAREVYGAEGMALFHGYLPPVKPDRYVHTNLAMEYTIDTEAQMVKALWDQWDYSGDEAFLRDHAYPAIRDAAEFYASYGKRGEDGRIHFIPSLEAEAWGLFPGFARDKDTISSLCLARWTFERAADGARILGVDAPRRGRWLELAQALAPYPEYHLPAGTVFNSVDGTVPSWRHGDHPWFIGMYPTDLADEINLDSPEPLRAEMLRTAKAMPAGNARETAALLGARPRGLSLARAVALYPELLLNSRSGRIWLFPGVGEGEVVGFRRLQARGGLLVSATRGAHGVDFAQIEARRSGECRLVNPWPGRSVTVTQGGRSVSCRPDGDGVAFAVQAGGSYLVSPGL